MHCDHVCATGVIRETLSNACGLKLLTVLDAYISEALRVSIGLGTGPEARWSRDLTIGAVSLWSRLVARKLTLLGQRKVVLQCARRDGRATLGRRRSMDKKRRLFPAARTAPVRLLPGDNRLSLTRNCGKNRADYKSLSHTTNL